MSNVLILVGLGLATRDISFRGLDEARRADMLLLETYTTLIPNEYLIFLEKETGKKLMIVQRKDLEDGAQQTVMSAKSRNVVILVPGDPLIATTHNILLNEAKKQGIESKVIHAASIFSTAIGESGLDVYKFGPTVTIPFWYDKYKPTSFVASIQKNVQNEQHTLVLLDINQSNNEPMKLSEALDIIKKAQATSGTKVLSSNTKIIIMANLGREGCQTMYLAIRDAGVRVSNELKGKQLALVVPGKLSFSEEESLKRAAS